MADGINVDRNKSEFILKIFSGTSGFRDNLRLEADGLACLIRRVDNGGASESDFTSLVGEGKPFPTTADAKAFWDETQSMNAVVQATSAAVLQWCAKVGI